MISKLLDEPYWDKVDMEKTLSSPMKKINKLYSGEVGGNYNSNKPHPWLLMNAIVEELVIQSSGVNHPREPRQIGWYYITNFNLVIEEDLPRFKTKLINAIRKREGAKVALETTHKDAMFYSRSLKVELEKQNDLQILVNLLKASHKRKGLISQMIR